MQAVRQPARNPSSASMESGSLDSAVYQIETVSLPRHAAFHHHPLVKQNNHNLVHVESSVSSINSTKNANVTQIKSTCTVTYPTNTVNDTECLQLGFINTRSLSNKALLINDLINEHSIDIMGLCETWLTPNNLIPLIEASPSNYISSHVARSSKKGGGVALIYNSSLNLTPNLNIKLSSCEVLIMRPSKRTNRGHSLAAIPPLPFYLIILYRPPGPYTSFLEEFSNFLSDLITRTDNILIIGDFNIHLNNVTNPLSKAFSSLIDTLGFTQFVHEKTHCDGNTLDLVLARGMTISNLEVLAYPPALSDHYLIKFKIELPSQKTILVDTYSTRRIDAAKIADLAGLLPKTLASLPEQIGSLDKFTDDLNSILCASLDSVAPLITKTRRLKKPTPWFTDDTRVQKQACRRLERKWRSSKLEVTRLAWNDSLLNYKRVLSNAKASYFSLLINDNKNNPKFLFDTVAKMTRKPSAVLNSPFTSNDFLTFFTKKIDGIRDEILNSLANKGSDPSPQQASGALETTSVLSQFETVSIDNFTKIVLASKSTTCLSDPLPAKVVKELFPILGPTLLNIVNTSLSTGVVPSAFKTAVIKPLLKKPNLDPDVLNNYRPISNLPFISKVLERIVANQLTDHLSTNSLLEPSQSGFRSLHSTETALTKVVNDLLIASDSDSSSILILLDLSAAFDTVDHTILLTRLTKYVGIRGLALSWLKSYLTDRTQSVSQNNVISARSKVKFGVPQGSVLGPLLFSIYMLPLGEIFRQHDVMFHCYADDTQIYLPIRPNDRSRLPNLEMCLSVVKKWMSANFLLLNANKTEMLVVGPKIQRSRLADVTVNFEDCLINQSSKVKNLGVTFDPALSFDYHIKDITKIAFFHLRNIAKIRPLLNMSDAETLIHAFVSSRLDYCNVLFSGLPKCSTKNLQLVQNAAARILTRTRKFDHITPILTSLHWLPIQARSDFKVLLLTYKSLHGLAPPYLSDLLIPYVPSRALRSQDAGYLIVPRIKKKSAGSRAFSYRAPYLWNRLPLTIREANSTEIFKSRLKTYLFSLSYDQPLAPSGLGSTQPLLLS